MSSQRSDPRLIVSDVVRANELQVWFVAEDVVDVPLAQAE